VTALFKIGCLLEEFDLTPRCLELAWRVVSEWVFVPQRYLQVVSEWKKSQLRIWTSEEKSQQRSWSSERGKSLQQSWIHICFRVGKILSTELWRWASERGKSLQQSPVSEWGKSYNGVSWRDVAEAVLLPPSGENPNSGSTHYIESC